MGDFAIGSEWALLGGPTDWDICRVAAYLNSPWRCGYEPQPPLYYIDKIYHEI